MKLPKLAAALIAITAAFATVGAHAQTKAAPAAPAPAPVMKPGLWEVAIAEQVPNTNSTRTTTARVCYSADDLKVIDRVVPPQREFGMKCENREIKARGADVTWKIVCTGKEASTNGAATMTLAAESYSAHAKLDAKSKGKASKVEQSITGKWISDCK